MLIFFVFTIGVGLQITSENFNSLMSSDPIVLFQISSGSDADYKLVLLGETLYLSPGELKVMADEVFAAWNKLIPSSGDAIIKY